MTCGAKISIRIDRDTLEAMRTNAEAQHRSVSAYIKDAIREKLDALEAGA